MQKLISCIFIIFVIFFMDIPLHAAETYNIDPMHTYVIWYTSHFGFSDQAGKFTNIEGTIIADEKKPENSKVTVIIPLNALVTGIPKLDEHLKSDDFLDIAKYPQATFTSNKIDITGKNTAKIHGTLNLHGVSKPIVLNASLLKQGIHPMKNLKSLGFKATSTIKRSDFNIQSHLPAIGDEVKLEMGVEANLTLSAKQ